MPGWDSYSQAVAADSPLAYWRLGELSINSNGLAQDSNQFPGPFGQPAPSALQMLNIGANVIQGGPSLISTRGTGPHDTGASFPLTATGAAANATLSPGRLPAIELPTITVECWVQPLVMLAGQTQFVVAYGATANTSYAIVHSGSSAVNHVFSFNAYNGGVVAANSAAPVIVSGGIYHVVGYYNGLQSQIYINGVFSATSGNSAGAITNYQLGIGLGACQGLGANQNLQGNLDEVAIYAGQLPAARILAHYQEGSRYLPFNWRH
jgi:hypothetical protein